MSSFCVCVVVVVNRRHGELSPTTGIDKTICFLEIFLKTYINSTNLSTLEISQALDYFGQALMDSYY